MTLTDALSLLPDGHRKRVEDHLKTLGTCAAIYYHAVCCLERETRLSPETWEAVLKSLVGIPTGDPNVVHNALVDCLSRWILNGPPLTSFRPKMYGRAVSMEYFSRLLVEQGYFGSISGAKRSIRSLLLKPREVVARRWQRYHLGKYLMWSTFSTGANPEDPFDGIPNSADVIRGALGLDPNERGEPLLLLVYSLPTNVIPRFPTVAEAFAGEKWNYFFTPAPLGAPYGMTMPWPEYEDLPPRPEVVHEVILGGNISAPLIKVL
ncbi:MAG: hypothetical protein ACREAC_14730 [Blastocatellia bacterium]